MSSADGACLSLEEVTKVIQKLREDQESFLEQQREAIIQQVLESIQRSGVLASVPSQSPPTTNPQSKQDKTSSPTARLEQNLHNLVHHSLAESGLDYPHVHNTAYEARSRSIKNNTQKLNGEHATNEGLATKKQVILSRREVERGTSGSASSVQLVSGKAKNNEGGEDDQDSNPDQEAERSLSHSPLHTKDASLLREQGAKGRRRRHHRRNKSTATDAARVCLDDDYSEFIDPVDAAFDAIRKKVDLRTLAILDRSKVLLGQVKENGLLARDEHVTEGRTSFVEKLRRRHAGSELGTDSNSTGKDAGEGRGDDNNQPDQQSDLSAKRESGKDDTSLNSLETEPGNAFTLSPDDIRCDLELLQPPSKAPDNDNEWENELARQILTIYATSIKAKALEKARGSSPGKQQYGNQNAREGSAGPTVAGENKRRLQSTGKLKKRNSLSKSVSLPAIDRAAAFKKSQHRTSSSPAAVHYSWEPSQLRDDGKVIINMPKVPRPIWFAGTGAVKAVWCALADGFSQLRPQHAVAGRSSSNSTAASVCDHRLCDEVRQLETKKKFAQCITTLESLLVALVRARGVDELETKLWKQLVVTCNAFASRCIDYNKFPAGLQLMKQAEHLIDNSILVDSTMRMELLAYLYDTYAHYYYKRRKPHAGLQYILKAHEIHSRQSSWSHLAKCRLHIANLLSSQIKHAEAMKYMASILEMIEENKLEENADGGAGGGSALKLCLAAVCYNNLAVEQLHMRDFEAASVSSANAQRLAKLCLSYSNRWLSQFQATSDCVALAIATLMEDTNGDKGPLADCRALASAEERRSRA
ncbi:hypothetical protein PF008_g6278 [Phytophthora fragariae]|uniref:Uncharacterized protein n=1 Tax=Phytophthora fragariae TaxID=53985 RepID=A0A6G0S6Y7_9STRA|nr:hypothetical protein PF008_g6278 [Phytophthora fragariae]